MAESSPSKDGQGAGDAEKRFIGGFNAQETAMYLNLGKCPQATDYVFSSSCFHGTLSGSGGFARMVIAVVLV